MIVPSLSALGVRFQPFAVGSRKEAEGYEFPVKRFVDVHSLLANLLQTLFFFIRPFLFLGCFGRTEAENLMLQFQDGFMKKYRVEEFKILTILNNMKITSSLIFF